MPLAYDFLFLGVLSVRHSLPRTSFAMRSAVPLDVLLGDEPNDAEDA